MATRGPPDSSCITQLYLGKTQRVCIHTLYSIQKSRKNLNIAIHPKSEKNRIVRELQLLHQNVSRSLSLKDAIIKYYLEYNLLLFCKYTWRKSDILSTNYFSTSSNTCIVEHLVLVWVISLNTFFLIFSLPSLHIASRLKQVPCCDIKLNVYYSIPVNFT